VFALACDLDFFVPSIPTGLTAIFLPRANVTKTRDVRALGLLLICHCNFLLFKSISLALDHGFLLLPLSALI
jgi:hypothetical protein